MNYYYRTSSPTYHAAFKTEYQPLTVELTDYVFVTIFLKTQKPRSRHDNIQYIMAENCRNYTIIIQPVSYTHLTLPTILLV